MVTSQRSHFCVHNGSNKTVFGRFHFLWIVVGLPVWILAGGCWNAQDRPIVVVYTALDREFSQPIFDAFERETGVHVMAKFDTESTKSVGLANAILAESKRPRCDVFWNNEILNTLRLQRADLLQPCQPKDAGEFPPEFRSPSGHWHGFAARARVFLVNDDLVAKPDRPTSIVDLADPRWKGTAGMAKPLFGTTATHAAILFDHWGAERAGEFFRRVHGNLQVLSGNRQVAQSVANGRLAWGITDTDDAMIEIEKGMPVSIVYPDQQADGIGTLFIPNTVAAISGGPHPDASQQLIDYLLSADVERRLAAGPSAQIPLRSTVDIPVRVETPKTIRAMDIDFESAVAKWDETREFLQDLFFRD